MKTGAIEGGIRGETMIALSPDVTRIGKKRKLGMKPRKIHRC
jgi:hypothetical protein